MELVQVYFRYTLNILHLKSDIINIIIKIIQSSSKVTLQHILDLISRKVHCTQVMCQVKFNYNFDISKSRVIFQWISEVGPSHTCSSLKQVSSLSANKSSNSSQVKSVAHLKPIKSSPDKVLIKSSQVTVSNRNKYIFAIQPYSFFLRN